MSPIRKFMIALLLIAVPAAAHAANGFGLTPGDGGQPGAFLDQTASARSIGLGQAFTGVADDASALHANPAGLVQLKAPDVVTMYSSLFEDTAYGSLMYARPLARGGAIGVGIIDLRSNGFKKTDANRQRTGTFDNEQTAIYLGHARRWRGFAIGGSVKVVRQSIDTYSGTGYGLDLGGFWRMTSRLSLGVNAQNIIAPTITLRSTSETYSRSLRMGGRYLVMPNWAMSADLQQTQQRSPKLLVGTEIEVAEALDLRAGINEREITAGLGFNIGQWTLDYAIGFQGALVGQSELGNSHRFGLHYKFTPKKPAAKK